MRQYESSFGASSKHMSAGKEPMDEGHGKESRDNIFETIDMSTDSWRSNSWCSSTDGDGSCREDDKHMASTQSTLPFPNSGASSPRGARLSSVVQKALTPNRKSAFLSANASVLSRAKRRLLLQEPEESDSTRAPNKRQFLALHYLDETTCTSHNARAEHITPTSELASRLLLLVDRPLAPSAATTSTACASAESGPKKNPHVAIVESKVKAMLVEEQDVSRVMCRVKGLNKLPLNKIKAALKDNPAVNMVSAETLPLMSRACEVFVKVLVLCSVEESLVQKGEAPKKPSVSQVHVSHHHVELAMLHSMMKVITERGHPSSFQAGENDDQEEDDEDEEAAAANHDADASAFPTDADSSMQEHTCGMSLDGPAPPSEAAVPLLDDNERDNEDEDGDGDGDCPVHVDDDGGVDYILPAYYAPIVSQGAYMHPPALNIKTSFPEYLDWSNFAPPSKPGPAFRIPQGDVHGCGASHDDWLDCLHEGSDAAAGLGVFEEACHVLDQTSMVLDMELDHMA